MTKGEDLTSECFDALDALAEQFGEDVVMTCMQFRVDEFDEAVDCKQLFKWMPPSLMGNC